MNLNQFVYTKDRRYFGRQCIFSDRNQMLFSIPPNRDLSDQYILRDPVNRSTQLSTQKGISDVLTENVVLAHHGMYHYEGGWPKDINLLDEEQTLRHRKKIERDDNWGPQVTNLSETTMTMMAQNSAVNIYQDYFSDLDPVNIFDSYASRPINVFHDLNHPRRPVSKVDWSPTDPQRLLSVHTSMNYFPVPKEKDDEYQFFVWDIDNPLKPLMQIKSPDAAKIALYCPRDENLIAGGLLSGKTALWDCRSGENPVAISLLEASHRGATTALCWVHSKSNTEFYTGSVDGTILYWDGRNINEPLMNFLLDPKPTDEQQRSRSHGVKVLEFEYTIPVRYVVGSDQGHVFIGNRKGMTPMDTFLGNYKLFAGPIHTIERNPFFVKNFLIVGDWGAKIWSEECKDFPTTFLVTKKNPLTCGTWSTARCSLFVTGDEMGLVDFWDLLISQRKPIYTLHFNSPIMSIKFRSDGELMAVALANGDVQILELDEAMQRSGTKDKALLAAMFERETLRSKLLQARIEEIHLKTAEKTARETAMSRKTQEKWDYGSETLGEEGGEEEEEEEKESEREEPEPNDNIEEEEEEPVVQEYVDEDPEYTETYQLFKSLSNQIKTKRLEKEYPAKEKTAFEMETEPTIGYSDSDSDPEAKV